MAPRVAPNAVPLSVDRPIDRRRLTRAALGRLTALIAVVAVVLGLVTFFLQPFVGVAVAIVVGGGLWFGGVAPRVRGADERVLMLVGGLRPADPATEARFLNLVEGLAPGAGLPRPRCWVIDEPVPNALTLGRDPRSGHLVVTGGLLDQLTRIELEGVVAHALARLRDGATIRPTIEIAIGGLGRVGGPISTGSDPLAVDADAVALTRYPPGLAGALRRIAATSGGPAVPPGSSPDVASLWLAPPGGGDVLEARIEALEEM